jgi:transposase-like protein
VVSDAAESISNSVQSLFKNTEHIRCYFHTVKAIKDKILRWKVSDEKKKLKDDLGLIHYAIKLLHRTATDENFLALWKLIQDDWEKKDYPSTLKEYINTNFIENRNKLRWNRLDKLGYNLTNNSLERFHGDIKQTYTSKKKLKLNEFLLKSAKIIQDCVIEHEDDFSKPILVTTEVWRNAIHILNDRLRGPFYDIKAGLALFIKKKRNIANFESRKK